MRHSDETKALMSAASRANWANPESGLNSPGLLVKRQAQWKKMHDAGKLTGGFKKWAGGKRADLGDVYFRSAWEANYARYLNLLCARGEILGWAYESKTFVFERIKRGTTSYTPDFRIDLPQGGCEWHEVKGWMNQRSRTRMDRMARYYPDEKVVIIGSDWFKQARRSGLAAVLPGWER